MTINGADMENDLLLGFSFGLYGRERRKPIAQNNQM